MLLMQIFVNDIIFSYTNPEEFSKCMPNKFEMSTMRELSFFLGLQIKHSFHKSREYINECKNSHLHIY